MITPIITGKVLKGKFIPNDAMAFKLSFCKHEGKDVELSIKRKTVKRSNNQNRYYYGVIIELINDYTGESAECTHRFLADKFLRFRNAKGLEMVRSTADLSTVEMEKYLEECRRFASVQGIYVPLPNEIDF